MPEDANLTRSSLPSRARDVEVDQPLSDLIIESSRDGILMIDLDLRYRIWNPGMEAISGLKGHQVLGTKAPETFPFLEETGELDLIRATLRGEFHAADGREYEVPSSGQKGYFDARYSPVYGEDHSIVGCLGIVRDVTEHHSLVAELRRLRDDAVRTSQAKAQFFADMSHEIRTPLTGIIGVAELLRCASDPSHEKELIRVLSNSTASLLRTVNEVLDFSRLASGKVEVVKSPFNLEEWLRCVAALPSLEARRKDLQFRVEVEDSAPDWVRTDRHQLEHVVLNLTDNAVKYTELGRVDIRAFVRSDQLYVEVADTGVGIPESRINTIFDAFAQAAEHEPLRVRSSGLGLSIGKRIMGLLGGTIGVRSVVGKGSTFWLALPMQEIVAQATSPETSSDPQSDDEISSLKRYTAPAKEFPPVLIVDDSEDNNYLTQLFVQKLGFPTIGVHSGEEALAALKKQRVCAVLMDLELPGIDGLETSTRMAKYFETNSQLRAPPVLALTAHAHEEFKTQCEQAGMADYLTKPLSIAKLDRALRTHVDGHPEEKRKSPPPGEPRTPHADAPGPGGRLPSFCAQVPREPR